MSEDKGYPALGTRVLRHVLVPLALTWIAGAVLALVVAHFFTQNAFDRSLLDDAYLLGSNVRQDRGTVRLVLTPHELRHHPLRSGGDRCSSRSPAPMAPGWPARPASR